MSTCAREHKTCSTLSCITYTQLERTCTRILPTHAAAKDSRTDLQRPPPASPSCNRCRCRATPLTTASSMGRTTAVTKPRTNTLPGATWHNPCQLNPLSCCDCPCPLTQLCRQQLPWPPSAAAGPPRDNSLECCCTTHTRDNTTQTRTPWHNVARSLASTYTDNTQG